MAGYLFDTNIWSYAFNGATFVTDRIQKLANSQIYLSAVVWGEVICGAKANPGFSFDRYSEFIHRNTPLMLPVDKTVAEKFGDLKAVVFEKKSMKTYRSKEGRASLLKSPIPSIDIVKGVHENDLWIAAQALAYNLVLVTCDRMQTIFELAPKELKYELWRV
jgi:predicted nucleic acid-binding protein